MLLPFQLNNQTFLKTAGSDPRWIKILDLPKDFLHLIDVCLDILAEREIIDNRFQIPPDIAVIFYAPDELLSDYFLSLVKFQITQLGNQLLVQGGLGWNGNLPVFIVGIVVAVSLHFIAAILVVQIIIQIEFMIIPGPFFFIGFFEVILLALLRFLIFPLFQCRVYFQFLLYPCIQLGGRHLKQFDKLDLLRWKLLRKRLTKVKLLHRNQLKSAVGL